jgi:hypothetical protein
MVRKFRPVAMAWATLYIGCKPKQLRDNFGLRGRAATTREPSFAGKSDGPLRQ